MHGEGVYKWADGNTHFGEFKDGNFHGIGARTTSKETIYGRYENGQRV